MEIYISSASATATAVGAAFPGVHLARAGFTAAGENCARTHAAVTATVNGLPAALLGVSGNAPAMPALLPVPAAAPLAMRIRKQNNVQKTRISAGGYGAMGPHPEREPA